MRNDTALHQHRCNNKQRPGYEPEATAEEEAMVEEAVKEVAATEAAGSAATESDENAKANSFQTAPVLFRQDRPNECIPRIV